MSIKDYLEVELVEKDLISVDLSVVDILQGNPSHNSLLNIQGGSANEYYHLTNAQHTDLTDKYVSINTPDLSGTGITDYTLVLTDDGKLIDIEKGVAVTLIIPANISVAFPIGTIIAIRQKGAGQITIAPVTGVTVDSQDGLVTTAQYAMASILKIATDIWVAVGSLET